jgi:hypothetical protein
LPAASNRRELKASELSATYSLQIRTSEIIASQTSSVKSKNVEWPNDQELSHAAGDVNREAELKAPTALAPVMC